MKIDRTLQENTNLSGSLYITTHHATGELVIPSEIEPFEMEGDEWIKYRFPLGGKRKKPHNALINFLKLADDTTSSDSVLKFARQWGVLCICEDNRFASHEGSRCIPRNLAVSNESYWSYFDSLEDYKGEPILAKMSIAEQDIWFIEPIWLWRQYAKRMKALINIFLSMRGDYRQDTSADWGILRQIEGTNYRGKLHSPVRFFEDLNGVSIQQLPLALQNAALRNILQSWVWESNLAPNLEWTNQLDKPPCTDLAIRFTLNGTYSDVGLFSSNYLTLFGVLVAQCITALGTHPTFRHCACTGCKTHNGYCTELLPIRETPGRPSIHCKGCYSFIRRQKKNESRKNKMKERNNQHE